VKLLTESEAAEHARYFDRGVKNPVRAFQRWARRAGVPVKRVGRARLYAPYILDAFLDLETWTRRHRELPVAAGERRPKPTLVSNAAVRSR
jgi:hypothetical protein